MTTVTGPTINAYFNRNPALVAQEKYSQETWNTRYAYITMVAYTALAVVAHIFLTGTLLPLTVLAFDVAAISAASMLVLPYVKDLFAAATKCKEQGDKETQIATKLQELRAMASIDLQLLFHARDIKLPDMNWNNIQQAPELALLARVLWREKQATDFKANIEQLKTENKFREVLEQKNSAYKAEAKAAFFASLIMKPTRIGKFKDHFAWVELSPEERALRSLFKNETGERILQTRKASPEFIKEKSIDNKTIGELGTKMNEQLDRQPATT